MTVLMKDVIEHYGVKGMRWGVRKKRDSSKAPKLDTKKLAKDKNPDDMTTAELKALVEDMRLRQQYNQIVASEEVPSGRSFVNKALENAGRQAIGIVTSLVVTKVVSDALAAQTARKAARRAG